MYLIHMIVTITEYGSLKDISSIESLLHSE